MPASEDAMRSSNVIKAGLATVPLRLSAFFASSSYPITEIQDWLAERDLSVLGILTTFRSKKGKGRREQLWIVKADEGIAEKLWQGLESSEELKLRRLDFSKFVGSANAAEESEDEDAEEVTTDEAQFGESYIARAYKQGNASATRKQTAPILRRLMEGL
jgi:exopolyphosphatase